MAKLSKGEKAAMQSMLTKMAFGIVGSPLNVKEASDGELGYTMQKENAVYVAFAHPYYDAPLLHEFPDLQRYHSLKAFL